MTAVLGFTPDTTKVTGFTPSEPRTVTGFTPQGGAPETDATPAARYSKQYGVDRGFVDQIGGLETGGTANRETATSSAGARGHFQLMPATFAEMGVGSNITDPDQNAHAGIKYLSQQLKKYGGNQALAAAAYNAGPGAVDAYLAGKGHLPAETIAYASHFGSLPHDTREADFRNQGAPMAPKVTGFTAAAPRPAATSPADAGFKAWVAKYGKGWDPVDAQGLSGGYRLRRAFELGLKPDAAGHLPDTAPNGEPLKTYLDPNKVTNGIDNGTGYQVAPPTYTGPLTPEIIKDAPRYFHAFTATRPGGPGGWDDVKPGQVGRARVPPAGYVIPPDPAAKYLAAAHPAGAGAPAAAKPTKVTGFTPHVAPATIPGAMPWQDPAREPAGVEQSRTQQVAPPISSALEAVGQPITFLTGAGGPAGALGEDIVHDIRGEFEPASGPLHQINPLPQTTRLVQEALTGKPGATSMKQLNYEHGFFETPAFVRMGLGGQNGAIQGGTRGVQDWLKKVLPAEKPNEAFLAPGIHGWRQWANDPNAPVMTESVVRGLGEFALALHGPGNIVPAKAAAVIGKTGQAAVKEFGDEIKAAKATGMPQTAARLEAVGNAAHRIPEAFDRYAAPLRDVHPADRAAARVGLRMHDAAQPVGAFQGSKLTDAWAAGLAPGAENRIVDAMQAMHKGQRVVNAATDEERAAGQALHDAVRKQPSMADKPVRESLATPANVSKTNPAGLTPLATKVLADHPGVDAAQAVKVANALEHAGRMPAHLTPDEIQRANKLAQATAASWDTISKHPALVEGIEHDPGYFPMNGARTYPGKGGGGRAPGQPAAVDYSHLKDPEFETVAEARQFMPFKHPGEQLFAESSPREVFRRAMARQMSSAAELDAIKKLAPLRGNDGRPLLMQPTYISEITHEPVSRDQALKDLETARTESAKPQALENVLGPGATEADLPKRRPRLATLGELRGVANAAKSAHGVEAQAGRDVERARDVIGNAAAGVEGAAGKVAGITAPTERVSAAMEPRLEGLAPNLDPLAADLQKRIAGLAPNLRPVAAKAQQRLAAIARMQQRSGPRTATLGKAFAEATERFGAESPEATAAWKPYSKAAEFDAKLETQQMAAKEQLDKVLGRVASRAETGATRAATALDRGVGRVEAKADRGITQAGTALNRSLGGVERSVASQAGQAAGAVSRAGQQGAERTNKALETTFARIRKGTARFDDRYKAALQGRELSLQQRDVLDRYDKELERIKAADGTNPQTLFDPDEVQGYKRIATLRQGYQGGESDLMTTDAIHKYLEANKVPPDVGNWLTRGLGAANRLAYSSLVMNPVIHTGWNEGGIVMAHMGAPGAEAVMDAFTSMGLKQKDFDDWFLGKKFSDEPGDTMRYYDTLNQRDGAWEPREYRGSLTMGREETPNPGTDYATMRTAPIGSLPTLSAKVKKAVYEAQAWNSRVVFNRGERIYAAYLRRHFLKQGMSEPESANAVRSAFSDDSITDAEKAATRGTLFFYPWMRTVNKLALKLGVQKPQTFNAPLQGSRVQRETVGAEGVQMSKSNPYALAKPSAQGGFDYWAPPIWNRSLEPLANVVNPTGPSASDRFEPAAQYVAGHLAPAPALGIEAMTEAAMGSKVPPWEQLWDPYGSGADALTSGARGVAGQFLYPLRAAEEAATKGVSPTSLIGGTTGHRAGKTTAEINAHEDNENLKILTERQKSLTDKGQPPNPTWAKDIEDYLKRGAHIERRGEWTY